MTRIFKNWMLGALLGATAIVLTVASPALAYHHHHRYWHHHHHVSVLHYIGMNYLHYYGPGPYPDTVAYYDGPLGAYCRPGSPAYPGQDHRAHPCY